jgi:exosortase/archaeosortase
MTTAEGTSETFTQEVPNVGVKVFHVKGTSAANSDTIDMSDYLSAIKGAYLICYSGAATAVNGYVGTTTYSSTSVLTVTNGGTGVWTGIVWGI